MSEAEVVEITDTQENIPKNDGKVDYSNLSLKDLGVNDESISSKFKSINDLVKSYKETQNYITKVKDEAKQEAYRNAVPDFNNAPDDVLKEYYKRTSGISDINDYGFNEYSDIEANILKTAQENGITKKQMHALFQSFEREAKVFHENAKKQHFDRSLVGQKLTEKYKDKKEFVLGKTYEYVKNFLPDVDFNSLPNKTQEILIDFVGSTYKNLEFNNKNVVTTANGNNLTMQEATLEARKLTSQLVHTKDPNQRADLKRQLDHLVNSANRKNYN
ncbi:MAG: hypothetical protein LBH46_02780 [Rickettsiales bacterium]|jgi:hypothetical protein|nr:hypothetical protein [Rickettsiales bacterium]